MNAINQSNQLPEGRPQSREERLYDLSLTVALSVVALMSILMYALPFLTAISYTSVIGPVLCAPWLLHQHKASGRDKQVGKRLLRDVITYTGILSVLCAVLIRAGMYAAEYVLSFL